MANGMCEVGTDDTTDVSTTHIITVDVGNETPAMQTREAFEKELIPVISMALDGLLPAIRSLETASKTQRAAALHGLLTKVTK